MKTVILFIFLTVGLLGCGAAPTEVAARSGFKLIGATVVSPNEPGWFALKSNPGGVALGKRGDLQGESRIFSVTIIQVDGSQSDRSFLAEAKSAKTVNDNPARFQNMKVSAQEVTFKGARCLRYEGSSQNTKASIAGTDQVYENNVGYTCRHPLRADIAVDLGFSSRSGSSGLPAAERNLAQRLFNSIQLNENFFDEIS